MVADLNPNASTTVDLTGVSDYSVDFMFPDSASGKDFRWINSKAGEYLGYYKSIPELKKAIDALAAWTIGKGWTADSETTILLDHVKGWGEDTFDSIVWNMIVCKKIFGDAFAEIIRDDKTGLLLNLKVLYPGDVTIITHKNGFIKGYEVNSGGEIQKYSPKEILHLCNDRVMNEVHGTSVIEACKWVIDARNEAMSDFRKILHLNMHFRYIEVDFDDSTSLSTMKTQYADAIANGTILLVPKGTAEIKSVNPSIIDPQSWIRYLENFFYSAVGVPKVILGGSEEFTEASSKTAYLTFEQLWKKEQNDFMQDFWNQVYLRVEFYEPASLRNEMLQSEEKNTGQMTAAQPHEMTADLSGEGL